MTSITLPFQIAEKSAVGWLDLIKAGVNIAAPYPHGTTLKQAQEAELKALATGKPVPRPTLTLEAQVVKNVAERWRISPAILWGVYGRETNHGANVKASSTGAVGPFQFEPATAKEYGYPLGVNENGVTSLLGFEMQASAAAHLLAANGAQNVSKVKSPAQRTKLLEEAIAAYNTGSRHGKPEYSLAQVIAAGKGFPAAFSNSGGTAKLEKEAEEGEKYPTKVEGSALEKFGELGITLILILAGAILLIYGVAVAVRPREKALQAPMPKLEPWDLPVG